MRKLGGGEGGGRKGGNKWSGTGEEVGEIVERRDEMDLRDMRESGKDYG